MNEIPLFKVFMADDAGARVAETLQSGYLGEGPRVAEFERRFGQLVGAPEPPLALNSGTAALELALYLAGVRAGDRVISTPMTCTATNGAIARLGASILWADVDPITGNIDPRSVADLLVDDRSTRRVKAIVAVDWGGRLCNYSYLRALGKKFGVPVVQDAAHSLLAEYTYPQNGDVKKSGDYVCWSVQAIKHLTTGDGGALLCPPSQIERARLLRWYGLDRTSSADFRCAQDITEIGWKAHMNDVAATIGLANLPYARWIVERHRQHADWYRRELGDLDGVTLPPEDPGSAWWLYTLLLDDRDDFIRHLKERGVHASPVHRRNDEHAAFKAISSSGPLPGLESFSRREVAIPVGWWLTLADLDRVAAAVREWAKARERVFA